MENLVVPAGKYVVAVSGGVDSVALLDLLSKQKDLELVVAHFDHGIRKDSAKDREFVATLSQKYVLPFEYAEGKLGPKTSEERARQARYKFLQQIRNKRRAKAIITAHHQDDVIETICLNLLRGTGRLGLSSLKSGDEILRPMLNVSKQRIKAYAIKNNVKWQEDSTNMDENYLRNWLRHKILNKLSIEQRKQFVALYQHASVNNQEINTLLSPIIGNDTGSLEKNLVINVPHNVAKEILAHWLRVNDVRSFDQKTLERLVVGVKTLKVGKNIPIKQGYEITIDKSRLHLEYVSSKNTASSV